MQDEIRGLRESIASSSMKAAAAEDVRNAKGPEDKHQKDTPTTTTTTTTITSQPEPSANQNQAQVNAGCLDTSRPRRDCGANMYVRLGKETKHGAYI